MATVGCAQPSCSLNMATKTEDRAGRLLQDCDINRIEALVEDRGEAVGGKIVVAKSAVSNLLLDLWDSDLQPAHAKPLEVVLCLTVSRNWVTGEELASLAEVLRANSSDVSIC